MSGMLTRVRAFSTAALKVAHDVARQQFVVTHSGVDAFLAYDKENNNIIFHTTEVPPQFQGKGVGKLLAQYAFDYAKQNNLEVTCKCHFLANFYEKNAEKYSDLKIKFDLE